MWIYETFQASAALSSSSVITLRSIKQKNAEHKYVFSLSGQRHQNDPRYPETSSELRGSSRCNSDHNQVVINHVMSVSNTVQFLLAIPRFIVYRQFQSKNIADYGDEKVGVGGRRGWLLPFK